jgi:hypothetical protein
MRTDGDELRMNQQLVFRRRRTLSVRRKQGCVFALKEHIQEVVDDKSEDGLEKVALDPRSSNVVLEKAIELRRALARDVGTWEPTALAN